MRRKEVKKKPKALYLSLGSNIRPRIRHLQKGIQEIQALGIRIEKISSLYRTSPVGFSSQPEFLNAVVKGYAGLSPDELLSRLKEIEKKLGRKFRRRWGPRVLDLDILLYGEIFLQSRFLATPHPRMEKRKFVLVPLVEIAPRLRNRQGVPYRQILQRLGDSGQHVRLYRKCWIKSA